MKPSITYVLFVLLAPLVWAQAFDFRDYFEDATRKPGKLGTETRDSHLFIGDLIGVTVGTPVTGCPPYRSVREVLPHTAPALSIWRQKLFDALVAGRSTRSPGLVSGSWLSASSSSWPMHFPLPTPQGPTSLCSPASQVLLHRPTPRQRTQWDYGFYPCPRCPDYCRTLPRYPDSRAESVHTCQVLRLRRIQKQPAFCCRL